MSNFCEFVDGDMTEEDRKKIDGLLIKIAEENELTGKIGKLETENKRLREALEVILDEAQKDEPCIMAIKVVAYTTMKSTVR